MNDLCRSAMSLVWLALLHTKTWVEETSKRCGNGWPFRILFWWIISTSKLDQWSTHSCIYALLKRPHVWPICLWKQWVDQFYSWHSAKSPQHYLGSRFLIEIKWEIALVTPQDYGDRSVLLRLTSNAKELKGLKVLPSIRVCSLPLKYINLTWKRERKQTKFRNAKR